MSRKSNTPERGLVRKEPSEIGQTDPAELDRLAALGDADIDRSDIHERAGATTRIARDASGRIVKPPRSRIRSAVLRELRRRRMSGHQLWIEARKNCLTIPESAVYEFISGKRQIGLTYLDAILEALQLMVGPRT